MRLPVYLRVLLAVAVIAALYTAWRDRGAEAEDGTAASQGHAVTPRRSSKLDRAMPPAAVAEAKAEPVNLFPAQGRVLPPPVPAAEDGLPVADAAPRPPLGPPPLPLRVAGVWRDDAARYLVLSANDATFIVCAPCRHGGMSDFHGPSDIIAEDYRIKKIENRRIVFEFIPMKTEQILPLDGVAATAGN